MAKVDPLDPAVPAGSEDPKLGNDRIQELARAVAELLAVDHYMGTDGGSGTGYNEDAAGEHNKATLRVQGSKPAAVAGKGYIYAKTVSGVVELFYENQAGVEVQITANGILNSCNLSGNQTVAGVKTFSSQPSLAAGLTAAAQLISTLADGTAPLSVVSGTKVTNLNADKVDGFHVVAPDGTESYTFPGGRIEKSGTVVVGPSGATVTFAQPFPNGIKSVNLTIQYSAWSTHYAPILTAAPTVTEFSLGVGNVIRTVHWHAIGW